MWPYRDGFPTFATDHRADQRPRWGSDHRTDHRIVVRVVGLHVYELPLLPADHSAYDPPSQKAGPEAKQTGQESSPTSAHLQSLYLINYKRYFPSF